MRSPCGEVIISCSGYDESDNIYAGIYTVGNVTISDGTVDITAELMGIFAVGNVTIEKGKVTIGAFVESWVLYGIYTYEGNVIIKNKNGKIEINNAMYGIDTYKGDVNIEAGVVTIKVDDKTYMAYGIAVEEGNVTINNGTVTINADGTGIVSWGGKISISGGNVKIYCGSFGIESGGYYDEGIVGGKIMLYGGTFDIIGQDGGAVMAWINDVEELDPQKIINQIDIKNVTLATEGPENGTVAAAIDTYYSDGEEWKQGIVTFTKKGVTPEWSREGDNFSTNFCERVYGSVKSSGGVGGGGGSSATSYTVKFDSNGGTDVRNQSVVDGGKAKVPVAPQKDGFILEGWYTDSALTKKYDFDTPVTGALTLYAKWNTGGTTGTTGPTGPAENLRFNDISSHWAKGVILNMADKEIINGYTDSSFKPDNPITRAEYLTMMVKALGVKATAEELEEAGSFADAAQIPAWASEYVTIGKALGIAEGDSSGNFNPYSLITRQDMFVMTYRALQAMAAMEASEGGTALSGFTDRGDIAAYAAEAMQTLVEKDLVAGSGGKLNPKKNANRAEAAQFLSNILDYVAAALAAPAENDADEVVDKSKENATEDSE